MDTTATLCSLIKNHHFTVYKQISPVKSFFVHVHVVF